MAAIAPLFWMVGVAAAALHASSADGESFPAGALDFVSGTVGSRSSSSTSFREFSGGGADEGSGSASFLLRLLRLVRRMTEYVGSC